MWLVCFLPSSPRAATFHAMDRRQVAEWMAAIGLDMYCELVEQEVPSGNKLVEIATAQGNQELIVSMQLLRSNVFA